MALANLDFATYIRLRKAKEADMIWRTPENTSASYEAKIMTIMGLPPRDPNNDDDEDDEDDEEDENEEEEEPAVIRDDE